MTHTLAACHPYSSKGERVARALPHTTAIDPVSDAAAAADAAARAAGCVVRPVTKLEEFREIIQLFRAVWGRDSGSDLVPIETLRALSHAGNHAGGAFADGRLVGAVVSFLGRGEGEVILHSHVMGLLEGRRSRGMGFALKQHQRAWALAQGIGTVRWTFDPLVRQNAYFNLLKLGAEATDYHVDFYGALDDELNAGEVSDRLLVTWSLRSERATLASRRQQVVIADGSADAATLLDVDEHDRPVSRPASGDRFRVRVPADIVQLRRRDPRLAREWRLAVRDTLGAAVHDGHRATVAERDGSYLLAR